jgi:hypothetical protein
MHSPNQMIFTLISHTKIAVSGGDNPHTFRKSETKQMTTNWVAEVLRIRHRLNRILDSQTKKLSYFLI